MLSIDHLADKVVSEAVSFKASDIHIVPSRKETHLYYRIHNRLFPGGSYQKERAERLVSHFKFMAGMDIGEKRRPQSGALTMFILKKWIGLRLSTLPTPHAESLVIRIIPNLQTLPIDEISLFPKTSATLISMLRHSHGLLLICGPTGSGKTTTLYSMLHHAKTAINRNIITLEDPIEHQSDDAIQVQINEKAGISYSIGLKAALRHDPDIIMIGEIRDAETARIAVRAALTGHLILSTMHAKDGIGAVRRLLEFGVDQEEVKQTLLAVTSQRLLELDCPYCEGDCSPYCLMTRDRDRVSVHELIYGTELAKIWDSIEGKNSDLGYKDLPAIIGRAVAYGFVREKEYERWVHEI